MKVPNNLVMKHIIQSSEQKNPLDSDLTILPPETFTSNYQTQSISWCFYNRKTQIKIEKIKRLEILSKMIPTIEETHNLMVKNYPKKSHCCLCQKTLQRDFEIDEINEMNKTYSIEEISFLSI